MDPVIAQCAPYVVEEEPGTRYWCRCGKSARQPYCDGSHKDTDFQPIPIKFEKKERVAWCGCKHSLKQPFCDGSHRNLMKKE
ncbi:MAG: Iron-binding zinc finger CDGSH type [candidate division BRC1 bacterium ADurb.BinA292]|nr:MAG: Iron-binding zinc finger CDGSH type [candidate division BRC1 bacterium ADurb.BinA292]